MKKRVAIIGSGISGMAAAYMLHPHTDITVFEKSDRIGGHTRTLNINYNGKDIAVDTGFIVLNNRNYPGLLALFRHLGVAIRKSDMSFAASLNNGAEEWSNRTLISPRALRRPEWLGGVWDILRFNRDVKKVVARNVNLSLADLLDVMCMGNWFRTQYILPMAAAIWSCPAQQILSFPARNFIDFFNHHGLLTVLRQPQWYTVVGGSQSYVDKITASYADQILTKHAVTAVMRQNGKVQITSNDQRFEFDEVIFGCHGDEALSILSDATPAERSALSAFGYQKNIAYLHRDETQMPKDHANWSSWNYISNNLHSSDCTVTYWMNNLQDIDKKHPLFVTLNPIATIAPDKIFDVHEFMHPVFTTAVIAAQPKIQGMQGQQNTWFCGAHLGYGFHEDGLQSAIRVVRQMGAEIPWL